jgi:hypothetical protein
MAFFVGPVDEEGNVDESRGHDVSPFGHHSERYWSLCHVRRSQYLARKIGEAGQRFAVEHWSWTSMQAYVSEHGTLLGPMLIW